VLYLRDEETGQVWSPHFAQQASDDAAGARRRA
jgi:hypothetical protein